MAKKLSKEWFEFWDMRRQRLSQREWIPVYCMKQYKKGRYDKIGYIKDSIELYSIAIFNGENRRNYLKMTRGAESISDELSDARYFFNAAATIAASGSYKSPDVYCGDKAKELGFKLILQCCKDMDNKGELVINQDFVLAYDLIQEGDNWYETHIEDRKRIPNKKKQVIRRERNSDRKIISIEIRADILKDYLAARDSALRLYCFSYRDAVMSARPLPMPFRYNSVNTVFEDKNTKCEVIIRSVKRGVSVSGEWWRGEWVERSEWSKIGDDGFFNQNREDFDVWIIAEDSGPKKISLNNGRYADRAQENYLWFDCSIIKTLLDVHNAQIDWYGRNEGKLFLPAEIVYSAWHKEWHSAVFFHIHCMGNKAYIIAKMQEIRRLNNRQRRLWSAYNVMPQEILIQRPNVPEYADAGRHLNFKCYDMKKIPEWRLSGAKKDRGSKSYHSVDTHIVDAVKCGGALEQCNTVFQEKFDMPLFKMSRAEDKDLMRRLNRFQALDERGLRGLAVDMVVYSIEGIDNNALKRLIIGYKGKVADKDNKPFGSLKLLEEFLKLMDEYKLLERDAKGRLKMLAPLFGLNDLRNSGWPAHGQTSDKDFIENCYSRIGVDRAAPYVEQGAQLLERVAECFEQIAEVLECFA